MNLINHKLKLITAAALLLTGCGANEPDPAEDSLSIDTETTAVTTAAETTSSETTTPETTAAETTTPETTTAETTAPETTASETTAAETTAAPKTTASALQSVTQWNENDMFHYGLVPVEKDGKFGFMNEAGEIVIEPVFDSAGSFDVYGLAQITSGEKIGWVDTSGNVTGYFEGEVTPMSEFGIGNFFENGLAPVWYESGGFIDKTGKFVVSGVSPSMYYYDEFVKVRFSKGGLAPVCSNGKWGYVDSSGKFAIEPIYDEAYNFDSEGLALVEIWKNEPDRLDRKCGFIDESGNFVIEPIYDGACDFYTPNCTYVYLEGKGGMIINRKGEVITENVGSGIDGAGDNFAFSNGMRLIDDRGDYPNTKYGYIDDTGKLVIEPIYEYAGDFAECGLAAVRVDDKLGFIDKKGKMVIEPQFDGYSAHFTPDGIALVSQDSGDRYIDVTGKYIDDPAAGYHCSGDFSNGLAEVRLDGKYGYIDTTGKLVIEAKFDSHYSELNEYGNPVWMPYFDEAAEFTPDGYAIVGLNGKNIIINRKGENILPDGYGVSGNIFAYKTYM